MVTHGNGSTGDWSFRDARRRLVHRGRRHLAGHAAAPRLDDDGNRLVDCGCGWTGNGLGWSGHLDDVVRAALDETHGTPAD